MRCVPEFDDEPEPTATRRPWRALGIAAAAGILMSAGTAVMLNTRVLNKNTNDELRAAATSPDPVLARRALVKLYENAVANLAEIEAATARNDEAGMHARILVEHLRRRVEELTAKLPSPPPPQPR
jgi:hypothetical protein